MVTSKDIRNYNGSDQSPTSSFRDGSSACSLIECSEVLTMGYARRVERGRRVENELEPSWRGALAALI